MRKISIIKEKREEMGRTLSVWEKRTGFIQEGRMSADELVELAGWPVNTSVFVCQQISDETIFDTDFEEDKASAELIGNENYGYLDGELSKLPPDYLNPNEGESWVFVLGDRLYLN